MVYPRKIAVIVLALSIPVAGIVYALTPATTQENITAYRQNITIIGSYFPSSSGPFFSNVTIPADSISVQIDMSLNVTYYGNGTRIPPNSVIVGIFSGNHTSWDVERVGYYQPSRGYYEISINKMDVNFTVPLFDHNNSSRFIGNYHYNYTFSGKSYNVGIDPSLTSPMMLVKVNWIRLVYTHSRL